MHVPDGYLSPSTCAALFAAALPFWSAAVRRMRALLSSRVFPLVSLAAAFSFVVMMFNLPLPGGTTGHATSVAVSAIVLGPWASIIAVSVALTIQALFFGDGGITAIGANCFNIAIVGSLVAAGVYRTISGRSAITSKRRVIAAGIAGYAAINAAALVTAVEFGIQPILFRDPTGAPLFAPYPLSVAVPAVMLGHLTLAGLAEALLTAGVVRYLQRAAPHVLAALPAARPAVPRPLDDRPLVLRPVWAALVGMMVLTPIGLLAAGAAWGEWGPEDFADPAARAAIVAASGNAPLPESVPAGLQRLSSLWTAPLGDYAPGLFDHPGIGYLLSAMFGTGLIVLTISAARAILSRPRPS